MTRYDFGKVSLYLVSSV